jgi:hypothetical protein
LAAAGIGESGAGGRDAAHGEPSGHMVAIGKKAVLVRVEPGQGPLLNFAKQRDDPEESNADPQNSHRSEPHSFSYRIG